MVVRAGGAGGGLPSHQGRAQGPGFCVTAGCDPDVPAALGEQREALRLMAQDANLLVEQVRGAMSDCEATDDPVDGYTRARCCTRGTDRTEARQEAT